MWTAKEHHVRCMNHIINIAVQKFLQTCKVLGEVGDVEDDDLIINEDDADATTMEEEDEREVAARIQASPEYSEEIAEAATHFKDTMHKLREIGKVRCCNTQN